MANNNSREIERTRDQVLGCMVGGAVGDALGYPIEFDSWASIARRYGERGITRYALGRRGLALISDDTQMSLFTAAGILLGMTRGCLRGIMGRLDTYCRYTYVDWLHTQEWSSRKADARIDSWLMDVPELYSRRAPGNTCLSALLALEDNEIPENDSCGCGGVMRTAPIALICHVHDYSCEDDLYCDMVAAEAARITHKHPLGFIPSAILNDILMQILAAEDHPGRLESYVEEAMKRLPEIESEDDRGKKYGDLWPEHIETQKRLIDKALELAGSDVPDPEAIESIGGGWTGHEALAIALYSAVKYQDSFEDAVVSCVNHSGDSDSTGAICGNIMGCLLGRSAIPAHFTDKLELLDVIEELSADLFSGCTINEYSDIHNNPDNARWHMKYCKHRWEPMRMYNGIPRPEFTPERIMELKADEVFVFGSNLAGRHLGGAAYVAHHRFGAVMGQGVGLQGQSYAIPTMQGGVDTIKPYVDEFIKFAVSRPDLFFYVTRIGCGIAGFQDEEIAPLFAAARTVPNICLPESFA